MNHVRIRRQWNDWRIATVPFDGLSGLHWATVSGGVRLLLLSFSFMVTLHVPTSMVRFHTRVLTVNALAESKCVW
jgi:hypothetical protein